MDTIINLQPNSPIIKEDLILGILSCTINIDGNIKTYYFQHVHGGLIVNDQLAIQLRHAFERANIQDGDNGISTSLDSFIPTEVMDTSLIGIRQVGIDYLDKTNMSITIEQMAIRSAKMPQALVYYMLDEVLQAYKSSCRVLRFHISSEVTKISKQQGFYQYLTKFVESRGLRREAAEGTEMGYGHEDSVALEIMEIKRRARQIEVPITNEIRLDKLRLQSRKDEEINSEIKIKPRKLFSFTTR
jgi:hypothetical protein